MPTPRQIHHPNPDPEQVKRNALRLAKSAVTKAERAERAKRAALSFALEKGASLREVEAATGVPFSTVQRIVSRDRQD